MAARHKLALIHSSARKDRFGDKVMKWATRQIEADGRFEVTILDPITLGVMAWHGDMDPANLAALKAGLDAAEAFIITTAEYNHSFPAAVKSLIDAGKAEWEAKPVGFVSYGGISGGLRSVEALRLVLAELHAVTLRDTVSFAMPFQRFSDDGTLNNPKMAEQAMHLMLNRLDWWTTALSTARAANPYQGSAKASK